MYYCIIDQSINDFTSGLFNLKEDQVSPWGLEQSRNNALEVVHLWKAPAQVRQYLEGGDESLREQAYLEAAPIFTAAQKAWNSGSWGAEEAAAFSAAWALRGGHNSKRAPIATVLYESATWALIADLNVIDSQRDRIPV